MVYLLKCWAGGILCVASECEFDWGCGIIIKSGPVPMPAWNRGRGMSYLLMWTSSANHLYAGRVGGFRWVVYAE